MGVNNYIIRQDRGGDKQITIPMELNWDFAGQDQSIEIYEEEIVKKVIGVGYDFEVDRFPHEVDSEGVSKINYQFNFHKGNVLNSNIYWDSNYINQGFTVGEIYYNSSNFTKSFFKLDLYDSVDNKRQTNYMTIIIPTQQGLNMGATLNSKSVEIKQPTFELDYIGDKEGFFIYWLKKLDFLNINTFYMTAKFYNAKTGKFIKMMNQPQSTISGDIYNPDSITYYYYRVVLDYINQTYKIFDLDLNIGERRGTSSNPIKWYEYVNPPE
jgi:hypothetical protein